MTSTKKNRVELQPLKVSCGTADCEQGLHCFRKTKRLAKYPSGACQQCGKKLVDWPRVHQHDPADAAYTFEALKTEWIRHHFWHEALSQRAMNYALRKGRSGLLIATSKRIRVSVGVRGTFDGRQTPFETDVPIHYAQHATACCCRRCIEYWHGIPPDRPLLDEEIEYLTDLCMRYLHHRLPDLPEKGQNVPALRGNRGHNR